MQQWEVRNNMLTLVGDNGVANVPSASYVFDALGYGSTRLIGIPNPADELTEIKFSKRGARLSFDVDMMPDGSYVLHPLVSRLGRLLDVEALPVPIPEHYVHDNNWIYFSEGYDDATASLMNAGIESFGPINLSQYCRLIGLSEAGVAPSIETTPLSEVKVPPTQNEEPVPITLNATLYPYQSVGFKWLNYMSKQTNGCVLGDEMGLGKTIQVITFLLARHEAGFGTSLVIVPVSLMENWRRELAKFAPSLDVLIHHGAKRAGSWKTLDAYDVVVMSYGSAISDLGMLAMGDWDVVVLDEAQSIKNPDSLRSATVKAIPRSFGLAVSGTPFENHILDVWSVMNFAEPMLLGERAIFTKMYPDDLDGAARLEKVITPFILRRVVSEVANDLPERIDVPVPLVPLDDEAMGYERVRSAIISETAPEAATLATLTRLRMYCTHPNVLCDQDDSQSGDPYGCSAKYQYFCALIEKIRAVKEKVLVFTSYRRMFSIFVRDIPERFGVRVLQIDGSTSPAMRQGVVDEFSDIEGCAVLVLNPTAAGTGLNITSASHVIHYNLEWNPAKEDQATARAYRRGQRKNVFVYSLFYANTVEETIHERMDLKRAMAGNAIVGTQGVRADREAIIRALSITPTGG